MAWWSPGHYLKQCWNIVNWTLRNKLQWNFIWISNIFIQENAFESVICEMAAILSRPQCVKLCFLTLIILHDGILQARIINTKVASKMCEEYHAGHVFYCSFTCNISFNWLWPWFYDLSQYTLPDKSLNTTWYFTGSIYPKFTNITVMS